MSSSPVEPTAQSARAILDGVLVAFRDAFRPYVEECYLREYGAGWRRQVGLEDSAGREAYFNLSDPKEVINHLLTEGPQGDLLLAHLSREARGRAKRLLRNLQDRRNSLAHFQPSITPAAALAAIGETRELIATFGLVDPPVAARLDALEQHAARILARPADGDWLRLRREYVEAMLVATAGIEGGESAAAARAGRRGVAGFVEPRLVNRGESWSASVHESRGLVFRWGGDDETEATTPRWERYPVITFGSIEPSRGAAAEVPLRQVRDLRRVAIVGGPGSGKSTLLLYLARMALVGEEADARQRTPILLSATRLAQAIERDSSVGLRTFVRVWATERFGPFLDAEIDADRALVLVDGIDEVSSERSRAEVLATVRRFALDQPLAEIVVTSRPLGYNPAALGEMFHTLELQPLDKEMVRTAAQGWLTALGADDPEDAAGRFMAEIESAPGVRELATTPLLLSVLVRLWHRGARLPQRRIELYQQATALLVRDRPRERLGHDVDEEPAYRALERLALELLATGEPGLLRPQVLTLIASTLDGDAPARERHTEAIALLRHLSDEAGILAERGWAGGEREYGFIHRAFAEYLAARHLYARWSSGELDLAGYLHRDPWREVIRLAFAHAATRERAGATALMRALLAESRPLERHLHGNLRLGLRVLADRVALDAPLVDAIFADAVAAYLDPAADPIRPYLGRRIIEAARAVGRAPLRRAMARVAPEQIAGSRWALLELIATPDSGEALRSAVIALARLRDEATFPAEDIRSLLGLIAADPDDHRELVFWAWPGAWLAPVAFKAATRLAAETDVRIVGAGEIASLDPASRPLPPVVVDLEDVAAAGARALVETAESGDYAWLAFQAGLSEVWPDSDCRDLVDLLRSEARVSASAARQAVEHLARSVAVEWGQLAAALIRTAHPTSRAAVVRAVGRAALRSDLGNGWMELVAPDLLGDPDPEVRASAVLVLKENVDPVPASWEALLSKAAADDEERVRILAARARLALRSDEQGMGQLVAPVARHVEAEWWPDEAYDWTFDTLAGLAHLDSESRALDDRQLLNATTARVLEAVKSFPDGYVMHFPGSTRGESSQVESVARRLTGSTREETRAWTGFLLGWITRSVPATAELSALLADLHQEVLLAGAHAVREVDLESVEWLDAALPSFVRWASVETAEVLGRSIRSLATPEQIRPLTETLELLLDESPDNRSAYVLALTLML